MVCLSLKLLLNCHSINIDLALLVFGKNYITLVTLKTKVKTKCLFSRWREEINAHEINTIIWKMTNAGHRFVAKLPIF